MNKVLVSVVFILIFNFSYGFHKTDTIKSLNDSLMNYFIFQDDSDVALYDSLIFSRFYNSRNSLIKDLFEFEYQADETVIPAFSDSVYSIRLAELNSKTPLNLDYNSKVRAFIELYLARKRELTSRVLGETEMYFPIFEEMLSKYNMPLELKYLAIVESALNPTATSPAGARGLWQFMYGTGKIFGLKVNSYMDERTDPYKSTEAACKYLTFLYKIFDDWHLALAAYNAGPGNVNKAIRRSGGKKNYWELYPYLPKETRGYIPAFIAVNYVVNYFHEHNLKPVKPNYMFLEVDTIQIKRPISFDILSQTLNIPVFDIRKLNPVYRNDFIPCIDGEFNTLRLPKIAVGTFLTNEDSIYQIASSKIKNDVILVKEERIHRVRKGETLKSIARKYEVSQAELKTWNNIHGVKLKPGTKIKLYQTKATKTESFAQVSAKEDKPIDADTIKTAVKKPEEVSQPDETSKIIYYKVRRGDTVWKISQKYQGASVEQIKRDNRLRKKNDLKVGETIKIKING